MNKKIEQIKEEYGIFARMGLLHMLTIPNQILTDERVAKEIEKLHQEETENQNVDTLTDNSAMEKILLAASAISKVETDDLIQFIKDDFHTISEHNKEIEIEDNGVLAIKRLFFDYNTDEPDSLASLFNEFSLEYKIAWNHRYDTYALIDVQNNAYVTIIDQVSFHKIVDELKEIYPELYEETLEEVDNQQKQR